MKRRPHDPGARLDRFLRKALYFFHRAARRPAVSMATLAGWTLCYHLLLAVLYPLPAPRDHDEFSYLLGADTFASGRLANPTHPMGEFFETYHVLMWPSYASKYPPGQALTLALGRLLFGHEFWGVVLVMALGSAAAFWAVRPFVRPFWSLMSGLLCAATFGGFHDWSRTYWGGGVAFLGGLLMVGAYGRLTRRGEGRAGWALVSGAVLLLYSRPYEGLLLGSGVLAALGWHAARKQPGWRVLARSLLWPVLALFVPALAFQASLNRAVTGNWTRLPYVEHARQYVAAGLLWPMAPRTAETREGSHPALETIRRWELDVHRNKLRLGFAKALGRTALEAVVTVESLGVYLLWIVPLGFLFRPRLPWDLVFIAGVAFFALLWETWMLSHYAAPVLAVLWVLKFSLLQHFGPNPFHKAQRSAVPALIVLAILFAYPLKTCAYALRAKAHPMTPRAIAEKRLAGEPGSHLVFVRRSPGYNFHFEWVYNKAGIDGSPIVWARDLGEERNRALIRFMSGRRVWIWEPERDGALAEEKAR